MRKPPNERLTGQARTPAKAGGQDEADAASRFEPGRDGKHVPERKCILTGAHDARDNLIRLALAPDGTVAPDVRACAPGRGAWTGVDRAGLEAARAKGKLKGALARAFKAEVTVPDDLADLVEDALRQAALDRLGLEARAGTLLTGSEKIEAAARSGQVAALYHAADARPDGNAKLDQAWRVGGGERQGLVIPAQRAILSLALGRQNVVHIAIVDPAAAARTSRALDRWRAFIGLDAGLSAGADVPPGDRTAAFGGGENRTKDSNERDD